MFGIAKVHNQRGVAPERLPQMFHELWEAEVEASNLEEEYSNWNEEYKICSYIVFEE